MCEIRVIQIFGLLDTADQITQLIVDGTSEECNQIKVRVTQTLSGITTSDITVTANSAGQWRAIFESASDDFDPRLFVCGRISEGAILASADCVTDDSCSNSEEFKDLNCGSMVPLPPPPPSQPIQICPSTSLMSPTISEECVDGRRNVVVTGVVTPEPGTIVSARIVLNDTSDQTVAIIDEVFGQTDEFSLGGLDNAIDIPPGEYIARLEITRPNYCGANTEIISVAPCPGNGRIPQPPDPPQIDDVDLTGCWIWFWINVTLFAAVGVLVFITLCTIEAEVWSAVAAIASGGALGAVWAVLTVLSKGMIIASIVLILIALISFILWIYCCAFGEMRNIICSVLSLLMTILAVLNSLSVVIALVLSILSAMELFGFGCAVGAWIDVAWFSILMSITWFVGQLLGCFPGITFNRLMNPR